MTWKRYNICILSPFNLQFLLAMHKLYFECLVIEISLLFITSVGIPSSSVSSINADWFVFGVSETKPLLTTPGAGSKQKFVKHSMSIHCKHYWKFQRSKDKPKELYLENLFANLIYQLISAWYQQFLVSCHLLASYLKEFFFYYIMNYYFFLLLIPKMKCSLVC